MADKPNGFIEALKQPDNMATMLVLAGALAQGQNNPGTVASKIGGALAFRGEMDNVRRDRNIQDQKLAQEASLNAAQVNDLASQGQARTANADYQRRTAGVAERQATVQEQSVGSENRLREAQAGYYDRMPQEMRSQLEVARLGLQAKRKEYYGQMLLGAQEGYNKQLQAALSDTLMVDPVEKQKRLQAIQAAYAQQTQAIATLQRMEEQGGSMGYLAYDAKTGSFIPMQLGEGLPQPSLAVVPQPMPKPVDVPTPEAPKAQPVPSGAEVVGQQQTSAMRGNIVQVYGAQNLEEQKYHAEPSGFMIKDIDQQYPWAKTLNGRKFKTQAEAQKAIDEAIAARQRALKLKKD